MRILLNFVPLKSGGGVQVGLDFVAQARKLRTKHQWYVVATEGTPFVRLENSQNVHLTAIIPNRLVSRVWYEYVGCRKTIRDVGADVIFTLFGPHWPGTGAINNVVGCAYSNLFYPEIDFWRRLPIHKKLVRILVDALRRRRVRKATCIVFETEDLAGRAVSIGGVDPVRVRVVRPAPSSLVRENAHHMETLVRCRSLPKGYRVLLLSNYNPNKNIELLPRVAAELRKRHGIGDAVFIITLPPELKATKNIIEAARRLGVESQIFNIGPIPQEGCVEIYRACDAVILLSRLESFSNTIAEAWTMGRPLIISKFEWSKELCGDAAEYVRYDDEIDTARVIAELRADKEKRDELIEKGRAMLRRYPTAEDRFREYLKIIEGYAR